MMANKMWTNERKLEALLRLPWSLTMSRNEEGGYWVMQVKELPAAIATGRTPEELEPAFWESLRETLAVFLEHGDAIPLPALVARYPWQPRDNVRVIPGQIRETASLDVPASRRELVTA
jgi:predicted RNase H-like HicB family nuclease